MGSGVKEKKKMCWAEDTVDEFSLAWHVTSDIFSQLSHGNICIVDIFSDYKIYTYSKNLIFQYCKKKRETVLQVLVRVWNN